jgi:hypothetical protein
VSAVFAHTIASFSRPNWQSEAGRHLVVAIGDPGQLINGDQLMTWKNSLMRKFDNKDRRRSGGLPGGSSRLGTDRESGDQPQATDFVGWIITSLMDIGRIFL